MLDNAGFANASIVGSGNLDGHMIADLKQRGAKIDIWGVGTKLSTGQPDGALGGIYKLGAIRRPGGEWQYRIKLSEESAKESVPGSLQVRRFHHPDGRFMADAIYEMIMACLSPAKSSMLRQRLDDRSLPTLVLQIFSCRFMSTRGSCRTNRRH